MPIVYRDIVEKEKLFDNYTRYDDIKVLRYGIATNTFIAVGTNTAEVRAGQYGFVANDDYGNFMFGPVGFSASWPEMKYSSFYRGDVRNLNNIPSTINTPVPMFKVDFPMKNLKKAKEIFLPLLTFL